MPLEPVLAAMVRTENTLDLTQARQARDRINRLLLREDIQSTLMARVLILWRQRHELTAYLMQRLYGSPINSQLVAPPN